jgi:urease
MVPQTSITFVSKASLDSGVVKSYELRKRVEAVKNCRKIGKKDMKFNDTRPKMKVDPERYVSTDYV